MIRTILVAGALIVSTSAFAQQPQQTTPSQVALQIDTVINQWAQVLENDQRLIADLQKQVADLKAASAKKELDKK